MKLELLLVGPLLRRRRFSLSSQYTGPSCLFHVCIAPIVIILLASQFLRVVLVLVLVLSFIFCPGSGLIQNPEDLIQKRLQHTALPDHIEMEVITNQLSNETRQL